MGFSYLDHSDQYVISSTAGLWSGRRILSRMACWATALSQLFKSIQVDQLDDWSLGVLSNTLLKLLIGFSVMVWMVTESVLHFSLSSAPVIKTFSGLKLTPSVSPAPAVSTYSYVTNSGDCEIVNPVIIPTSILCQPDVPTTEETVVLRL